MLFVSTEINHPKYVVATFFEGNCFFYGKESLQCNLFLIQFVKESNKIIIIGMNFVLFWFIHRLSLFYPGAEKLY